LSSRGRIIACLSAPDFLDASIDHFDAGGRRKIRMKTIGNVWQSARADNWRQHRSVAGELRSPSFALPKHAASHGKS
jgi:hypothetical protein